MARAVRMAAPVLALPLLLAGCTLTVRPGHTTAMVYGPSVLVWGHLGVTFGFPGMVVVERHESPHHFNAVFDVDAIGLVNIVNRLNHGLDIGGNPIGASTGFTIGCAANPGVPDIDNEIRRFAYKVEAGAEYAITQPVFDLNILEAFLKRIEGFRIPIIAGIWPLTSLRNAEFMKNDLRVSVPDNIFLRMQRATSPEEARAEGIRIAQEMLATVKPMVQGVQVSAPFGRYSSAADVLSVVLSPESEATESPAQPTSEGTTIA